MKTKPIPYKSPPSSSHSPAQNKGNIYYFILDGHIGLDGIPKGIPEGNILKDQLRQIYLKNGFSLFPKAYANFMLTRTSMGSIMNLDFPSGKNVRFGERTALKKNKIFEIFNSQGYNLVIYQNDFFDFCSPLKSINFKNNNSATCYEYSLYDLDAINLPHVKFLDQYALVLFKLLTEVFSFDRLRTPTYYLHSLNTLKVLEKIKKEIPHHKQNTFFLAHLLLPHPPYALDKNCNFRKDRFWNVFSKNVPWTNPEIKNTIFLKYFEQIECIQNEMNAVIDILKKEDLFKESTIIIHSDHGSAMGLSFPGLDPKTNLNELDSNLVLNTYSAFLAIKEGDFRKEKVYFPGTIYAEPNSINNFFRKFFNLPLSKALEFIYVDHDPDKTPYVMRGWPDEGS